MTTKLCIKLTFNLLIIVLISSCDNKIECSQFNYNEFGIDTTDIKTNFYYANATDTIVFKTKRIEVSEMKYSKPSFFTTDECDNSVCLTQYCESLDLQFVTIYNKEKTDYSYNIFSSTFTHRLENIKSINEINLTIDSLNRDIKSIKSFEIRKGFIDNFVDSQRKNWTRVIMRK